MSRRVGLWLSVGIVVFWLLIGAPLGSLQSKVSSVQRNDNASFLPGSAESTAVLNLNKKLAPDSTPAIVVYTRPSGLTPADQTKIAADAQWAVTHLGDKLAGPPIGPVVSADGQAARVVLLFKGSNVDTARDSVFQLRDQITTEPGLEAHVAGPVGIFADFSKAFQGIDGILLLVTGCVILLILFVVYRSPLLPFLVLLVAGFALTVANGIVYLLAKSEVITLNGQSQGILDVLVLGAGTDYALLLVSRYREELRRHKSRFDAMWTAWRASFEPILASGGTVILVLLCLLVSDLSSNRSLGPIGGIGIACALLAMLTLLPAALALLGRAWFWPFRPRYGSIPAEEHGIWARVARFVGNHKRLVWLVTLLVLFGLTAGLTRLDADGIPQTDSFTTTVDSKTGQEVLAAHFPAGSGNPAEVIANADQLDAVAAAARTVPGVAEVTPYNGGTPGAPPVVVDGLGRIDVTLAAEGDSVQAGETVIALREAVHAVPGADAKVGGFSAVRQAY